MTFYDNGNTLKGKEDKVFVRTFSLVKYIFHLYRRE